MRIAALYLLSMLEDLSYRLTTTSIDPVFDRETIRWIMGCASPVDITMSLRKITPDGTNSIVVDIAGDFDCMGQNLVDFKGVIFGKVGGSFRCSHNKLRSLAGAPREVGGIFLCNNNELTNLIGGPEKVEDLQVNRNQLVSLEGAPMGFVGVAGITSNRIFSANPVSERTLSYVYQYMLRGFRYQDALENFWSGMPEEDKMLMYRDHRGLSYDERRMYELMNRVKGISI
jgi:hypothetical protein